jgi:hypothetical protein
MKKIPPFKLVPEPLTEEARRLPRFKSAGPEAGRRHQLGGEPARKLRDEEWPRCPDCKQGMTFYGQFDSINDDIMIADVGMIYVFLCFECNEAKAVIDTA